MSIDGTVTGGVFRAEGDDALYRAQIRYLLHNSPFYAEKLGGDADAIGGIDAIAALPFTEKDELRASRTEERPIGAHLAAPMDKIVRIFSTSGTTGTPSYIPLTRQDLDSWITISSRSYGATGITRGERIVSTYNAGPFVAGAALDAFAHLGLCHIPVGSGNTERLMTAVQLLKPSTVALTPSYALHLAEWATARGIDLPSSSVVRLMVAGEPGGGEPAMRAALEEAWGAKVTEAMGIGDISVSLWGECQAQKGMHFSGAGEVHFELIDPETGAPVPIEDGAEGELVYTHLRQQAAPLLRFRSRDHVRISMGPCPDGRTGPRVRCIGRTDDMLIVRGVNLFPTALRELVNAFVPDVTGVISIRPTVKGPRQAPPLPVTVEVSEGVTPTDALADAIRTRIRDTLLVTTKVTLVPEGTLPRTDYKSKLIDWSGAS
ncbi:AMP-binding protein [Acuticoccus sp. MNP-M23]|uniref:phenylacetate--CoA ligase family protein n=1 Tax=Acuticoccus sp. MNP-M23 TaxID=3072793 RepID=UPI002814D6BD|nr:AMP-binding protein [Acuticoccus sp. MNP-M23]WMS41592.1 AMP-binding protein [Acuticoccus sp. MNP-M23]